MEVLQQHCEAPRPPPKRFFNRQLKSMLSGATRYGWDNSIMGFKRTYLTLEEIFCGVMHEVLLFPDDSMLIVFPAVIQETILQLPLNGDEGMHMCAHDFMFRYTLRESVWSGARIMVSKLRMEELCVESGANLKEIVCGEGGACSPEDE